MRIRLSYSHGISDVIDFSLLLTGCEKFFRYELSKVHILTYLLLQSIPTLEWRILLHQAERRNIAQPILRLIECNLTFVEQCILYTINIYCSQPGSFDRAWGCSYPETGPETKLLILKRCKSTITPLRIIRDRYI